MIFGESFNLYWKVLIFFFFWNMMDSNSIFTSLTLHLFFASFQLFAFLYFLIPCPHYICTCEKARECFCIYEVRFQLSKNTLVWQISKTQYLFCMTDLSSLHSWHYISETINHSWFNHICSPMPLNFQHRDSEIYYCIWVTLIAVLLGLWAWKIVKMQIMV